LKIDRIVVAVDGSENSRRAVEWAADVAAMVSAEVIAVHAVGLREHGEQPSAADRLRDEWCEPLARSEISYDCIVRDGNAVSVTLDVAEEFDADLIVLGSRGLGGKPALLLGSTSTQVAQRSELPVVIVPMPAASRGDEPPLGPTALPHDETI